MEYIAILIAFILGAYVRKPFIYHRQPKLTPKEKEIEQKLEEYELTMSEQYANIMAFNGKEQKK